MLSLFERKLRISAAAKKSGHIPTGMDPADARLTGATRSLDSRLSALNLGWSREQVVTAVIAPTTAAAPQKAA